MFIGVILLFPMGFIRANENNLILDDEERIGIDLDVHYFIAAEDHPDNLETSSIDTIAVIERKVDGLTREEVRVFFQ